MERLMENKRVRNIRRKVSGMMPAARRRKTRRQKISLFAAGSAAGAAVAFFLDPQRGRARRKKAVDRVSGAVRRTTRRTARFGRHIASDSRGLVQRLRASDLFHLPGTPAPSSRARVRAGRA